MYLVELFLLARKRKRKTKLNPKEFSTIFAFNSSLPPKNEFYQRHIQVLKGAKQPHSRTLSDDIFPSPSEKDLKLFFRNSV